MAGTAVPTEEGRKIYARGEREGETFFDIRWLVSRRSAYTRLAGYSIMRAVPTSSRGNRSHVKKLLGILQ